MLLNVCEAVRIINGFLQARDIFIVLAASTMSVTTQGGVQCLGSQSCSQQSITCFVTGNIKSCAFLVPPEKCLHKCILCLYVAIGSP